MMRQLGGSFCVAAISTFISSQVVVHSSALVSHLNINDPLVHQRVQGIQHNFIRKGMSPDIALKSAYQALEYSVTKQAMVLSYMDVFLYLGIMFLICVPFVLFVKARKNVKVDLGETVH